MERGRRMDLSTDEGAPPLEGTPPAVETEDHAPPTPMMAQFIEIKAANPDCLLFYRMGDFYELFFDDAEVAARALGIALTKRGRHRGRDVPMAGVPVHAADDYLQKLIRLGHRVAVCEQTEDPAEARKRGHKAIVRRDVVRLVTPGTLTEETLLEPGTARPLSAVAQVAGEHAIATIDISTGAFRLVETSEAELLADLARAAPAEIVVPDGWAPELLHHIEAAGAPVVPQPVTSLDAGERLARFFGVASVEGLGTFSRAQLAAAAAALAYVEHTQVGRMPALERPVAERTGAVMFVDPATRANLELVRTQAGEAEGSLLHAIDRTVSAAGGRLLAERLAGPLTDVAAIQARHDAVAALLAGADARERLRRALRHMPDMARATSRLALDRGGPRDLQAVARGLEVTLELRRTLASMDGAEELERDREAMQDAPAGLAEHLAEALADDLPLRAADGGFVREGFIAALDEARALARDARSHIAALQAKYQQATGARSLKVKHNNVLGHFIEVPQAQAAPLQSDDTFVHRQTMASAMRFSTVELGDLEARIAEAGERAQALELETFARLREAVAGERDAIRRVADAAARVDVAAALAELAEEQGHCRPRVDDTMAFHVVAGRHPVVEPALRRAASHPFVANDCELTQGPDGAVRLVTGPNMGGKSTYLRQNALIVLMAQTGAFVPAGSAHLGVVDRLFSRVGAADDLARGRSTFMVEMVETAAILNGATARSFVILDELGRGTATFDGLSIAWGTIEHLHELRARTLFATHYHELTALAAKLPRAGNLTMRVKEWDGAVVFLHEVAEGTSDRSYGIQVAKLAGLPEPVIARAKAVLAQLEGTAAKSPAAALVDDLPLFSVAPKAEQKDALREALAAVEPDGLTPREAHELVYRLKKLGGG